LASLFRYSFERNWDVFLMIPYAEEIIRNYELRGWWGKKTLVDFVQENAAKYPDKVAYI